MSASLFKKTHDYAILRYSFDIKHLLILSWLVQKLQIYIIRLLLYFV